MLYNSNEFDHYKKSINNTKDILKNNNDKNSIPHKICFNEINNRNNLEKFVLRIKKYDRSYYDIFVDIVLKHGCLYRHNCNIVKCAPDICIIKRNQIISLARSFDEDDNGKDEYIQRNESKFYKSILKIYQSKNIISKNETALFNPNDLNKQGNGFLYKLQCSNCETVFTCLWRMLEGLIFCNACYVYYKKRGINRPKHLKAKKPVKRRLRKDV